MPPLREGLRWASSCPVKQYFIALPVTLVNAPRQDDTGRFSGNSASLLWDQESPCSFPDEKTFKLIRPARNESLSSAALPAHGKAIVKYKGFEKHHRILGFAIIGFFKKALEISGAKDVAIHFSIPIDERKPCSELSIAWS